LRFSRPASPQKKSVDVSNLIERTLQLHEHSLRRNAIEVDFHPQPELPGVIGDANQLIQVFLNLVTNAEQAIREVRDSGRIQIRLGQSGNRLSVTVQDDGVGIRPDALPRIFDPFYTTKRPGGGTGLGLSICMSIIREHGGTIEAESLPAGGSAFTVYLPLAPAEASEPHSTPAQGEPPFTPSVKSAVDLLRGRRVLVLDDEESIRQLLHEGLSAHGLRVDSAATEEEALACVRKSNYDILLCDLNLSSGGFFVDGREAAARVLQSARKQKPAVIYMTGDLLDSAAPGAGAPGRGEPAFLQKPFRISDVLILFREVLATPAEPQPK
jgi:CheY-like chemotaxis protein